MSERVGDRDALGGFTAATFSSWWQQRISVALQLGNARCIIERTRRDQPQGGVMEGHDDSQLTLSLHLVRCSRLLDLLFILFCILSITDFY